MSINAYFEKLIANLIIKKVVENAICSIFKQKRYIITHNMNTQKRKIEDFSLHKLIFVLL